MASHHTLDRTGAPPTLIFTCDCRSNIWYRNQSNGESDLHLLIAQNAEHSLATGIPEVLPALSVFISSIAHGHPPSRRPSFEYDGPHERNGELTVRVPSSRPPSKVTLYHAETLQSERRDFRWVRLASNTTGACKLPDLPLAKPLFGGNCIQPIIWHGQTLTAAPDSAQAPGQAPTLTCNYSHTPQSSPQLASHTSGMTACVFRPRDPAEAVESRPMGWLLCRAALPVGHRDERGLHHHNPGLYMARHTAVQGLYGRGLPWAPAVTLAMQHRMHARET